MDHPLLDAQARYARFVLPSPADLAEETEITEGVGLRRALNVLPRRHRRILTLRFGLDGETPHTLALVGEKIGVCRERVRILQMRAMERLRVMSRTTLHVLESRGHTSMRCRGHAGEPCASRDLRLVLHNCRSNGEPSSFSTVRCWACGRKWRTQRSVAHLVEW